MPAHDDGATHSGAGVRKPSREACSAFTRVTACTLALSPIRDTLIEGFSHFVTSMTAPIASGWSGCRVGLHPLESAAFSRRTPETDIAPNRRHLMATCVRNRPPNIRFDQARQVCPHHQRPAAVTVQRPVIFMSSSGYRAP